jgi:hypothetical protein
MNFNRRQRPDAADDSSLSHKKQLKTQRKKFSDFSAPNPLPQ